MARTNNSREYAAFVIRSFLYILSHPLLFIRHFNLRNIQTLLRALKSEPLTRVFQNFTLLLASDVKSDQDLFTIRDLCHSRTSIEFQAVSALLDTQPSTDEPLISIIVLNLNGEAHLDNLLQSFLTWNSYPNFEFLVVDHGSSDNSIIVLQSWSKFLPINILACEQNYSFSYSTNQAAESAQGELLLMLNNDVIFCEDILYDMVSALQNSHTGAVGLKQYLGYPNDALPKRIYHIGVRFLWDKEDRFLKPQNQTGTLSDQIIGNKLSAFPAITASILLCRKDDFVAVDGFDEGYYYGYEDIDFCCKLRFWLNKETASLNSRFAYHNESTTRNLITGETAKARRTINHTRLRLRFGFRLRRDYLQSLSGDDGSVSGKRLTVGIAVTTTDMLSGAGDLYTAVCLGEALQRLNNWNVIYLPKPEWYNASGLDIYIGMRDDINITKLRHVQPHLITIAWIRNWIERWIGHQWTPLYTIHLCASQYGADFIYQKLRIKSHIFPIAVDHYLFRQRPKHNKYEADYVFTGNHWNSKTPREIEAFDPSTVPYSFRVFGNNWENHPRFQNYWQGFLHYSELPKVYSSCRITVDDTVSQATKLWGSVNSRVFESLASGSLVLTNNIIGSKELFDDKLPTWDNAKELQDLLLKYLNDETCRIELVSELRTKILSQHTYEKRAASLSTLIKNSFSSLRVAIKCPVLYPEEAFHWGDFHFAHGIRKELVKRGYQVRIDLIPDWYSDMSIADDIVIVLRGLTPYNTSPDQINICWMISHPLAIETEKLNQFDHVFVASNSYSRKLKNLIKAEVSPLLQCSDPEVFYPPQSDQQAGSEKLLFVGNSRMHKRRIVTDCMKLRLPISIYGRDWKGLVPSHTLKGEYIPNDELWLHYGTAQIVLNDHWPDMSDHGFISNRIFDIGLSGGFVISDSFQNADLFKGNIVTYENLEDLKSKYDLWSENHIQRKEMASRLREIVLNNHTFSHRVEVIDKVIQDKYKNRMFKNHIQNTHTP